MVNLTLVAWELITLDVRDTEQKKLTSEVLQKLCLELDALSGDKLIDEEGASMARISPKHSCSLELL